MSLQEEYTKNIRPALQKEMQTTNIMAISRMSKIIVNIGLGEALKDKKVLETMGDQLSRVTGQKPLVTRARRSIATYKLRAGMPIGLKVTLRGKRMYDFYEKLTRIVLPRVRDFRGISRKTFDGSGNMSIGFSEITVFPEIHYEGLDRVRGLEVSIVTTAKNDEEGRTLLEKLGMPFEKSTQDKA
ncbi:MAG TPA: 50S ribosomal protein L5 [Patescibacteria group bacterium]|nr:50S ribosomal protein L5 [Patescibacteria group bacterium]